MDGKELKELSDLWFFGFFFFHLDKKGDDWMIREDCDIPRLATTPEDGGWGCPRRVREQVSFLRGYSVGVSGPTDIQALSPPLYMTALWASESAHFWWMRGPLGERVEVKI